MMADAWEYYYNSKAANYDKENMDPDFEARAVLAFAEITPNDKSLLDLGCCTGGLLRRVRDAGHNDISLVGVDFAEKMVAAAKEKLLPVKPAAQIIQDDITTLQVLRPMLKDFFPDGFSVITAINVDYFMERNKLLDAISLWLSLLSKGGRLIVSHHHSRPRWHTASEDQMHGIIHICVPGTLPNTPVESLNVAPPSLYRETAAEMWKVAKRAGITPERWAAISFPNAIDNAKMLRPDSGLYTVKNVGEAFGQYLYKAAQLEIDAPRADSLSQEDALFKVEEWPAIQRALGKAITGKEELPAVDFNDVQAKDWSVIEMYATLHAQRGPVLHRAMDRFVYEKEEEIFYVQGRESYYNAIGVLCSMTKK